ncbi:RDD family protein [Microcella daejeonensis]|uniref:RDD family protein n=1 Tax=Microcella daejeonensis TaxID=2994971 RepID=UPI002270CAA6|nr:RDD family protein [Microcella daejeonensis]WAB84799.1 RDD family protein [Microcella daejeonensis]
MTSNGARVPITAEVDDDAPTPGLRDDGTPDPAYAEGLGLRPAGTGRRAAAFAIDAAAWAVLSSPAVIGVLLVLPVLLESASPADPAVLLEALAGSLVLILVGQGLTIAFGLVQLILHGRRGVTLGKALMGLRSVNVATFERPGFWRVVLRALVLQLSTMLLVVAGPALLFASGLWDAEGRGRSWLDRLARAWVIDARRGLDPFDAKAMRHARKAYETPERDAAAPMPSLATIGGAPTAFVPVQRSNSGVVSGTPEASRWAPPPSPVEAGVAPAAPLPTAAPMSVGAPPPATAQPAAPPAQPAPPAPAAPSAASLHFDDGTVVPVPRAALLGRDPEPRSGEQADLLLPLVDASMQLSKTHAAFGIDPALGFWMLDRGSSNGTRATSAAGELVLTPGERTSIPPGSTVAVGGRTFRVVAEP